jgi:hypothetical protein
MVVIIALSLAFAWIAHRAKVKREAVAAILKEGRGSVYYDWQYQNGRPRVKEITPKGPKWLRNLLGPELFDTVVYVTLRGEKLDDDLMEQVSKLDQVEWLIVTGLSGEKLTSLGMSKIGSLHQLQRLLIQGPLDSSGFLAGLAGTPKLRVLWLTQAIPTDADMANIGTMTDLEELRVDGSNVTDVGFAHLAKLKKLSNLEFRGPDITSLTPLSTTPLKRGNSL